MPTYSLVQIPTTLDVSIDIKANDIDEVRVWAMANIDTSTRWVVKLDGLNIGEAIVVDLWRVLGREGKATKKTFNSNPERTGWFNSKQEAEADYLNHKPAADLRLDVIEGKITELQEALNFELEYHIDGDTHGIHEEYQYISVTESMYEYHRVL